MSYCSDYYSRLNLWILNMLNDVLIKQGNIIIHTDVHFRHAAWDSLIQCEVFGLGEGKLLHTRVLKV